MQFPHCYNRTLLTLHSTSGRQLLGRPDGGRGSRAWFLPRLTRAQFALIGLGSLAELIYVLAFLRVYPLLAYYHIDIDMGQITGHSRFGFALFVVSFTILFLILAISWRLASNLEDHRSLWIIFGFGVIFAVTMSFVYPATAIDVFTYIAQSRILFHYHQNPIFVAPSHFPHDPLMALSGGWISSGSPYGPVGLIVDGVPTLFSDGNLLLNLILLKLMFSALLIAEAAIVFGIVRAVSPRHAVAAALLVAWNPLLLFEVCANGHNDIVMMVLVSLGLWALIRLYLPLGIVLGTASVLVKYASLPLLPLFLVYALTRNSSLTERVKAMAVGLVGSTVLVVLAYLPFWRGLSTLNRPLLENGFDLQSFASVLGSIVPGLDPDRAMLIGRILFAAVYAYALVLSTRRPVDLLRGCFLTLFFMLGLAVSNFKIWYATWPLVLGACLGSVEGSAALLMAYGATISAAIFGYLFVWWGESSSGFNLANDLSYVVAFAPAATLLGTVAVRRLLKRSPVVGVSDQVPAVGV